MGHGGTNRTIRYLAKASYFSSTRFCALKIMGSTLSIFLVSAFGVRASVDAGMR